MTGQGPIALAVVGGGRVAAAVHLPLIQLMPEKFRLAAIVDTDRRRAQALARQYPGARACYRLDQLSASGAQAVLCATSWPSHRQVVLAALELGLPVLCEKPVSLDPAQISELAEVERRSGTRVSVGYMKRHDPAVQRFIDTASELRGQLRSITVSIADPNAPHQVSHRLAVPLQPSPQSRAAADRDAARILGDGHHASRRTAFSHGLGGSLIHQVNLVQAILRGSGLRLGGRLGYSRHWADGNAVACGWWPSADLGVQMSHVRVPGLQRYSEVIEAVTESRRLTLALPSPYLLDRTAVFTDELGDGMTSRHEAPPAGNGFAAQLRAWAASVRSSAARPLPGLDEAVSDLLVVLEAARASAAPDACGRPRRKEDC